MPNPSAETVLSAAYLPLAECAAREYGAIPSIRDGSMTGELLYAAGIDRIDLRLVDQGWALARTEFRRIDDASTKVAFYNFTLSGYDGLTRQIQRIHEHCAYGRRLRSNNG